jgi:ABC-type uncharacterized transport system permease subunit
MRIFMDVFYYGAAIGFYKILFCQTGELVGWNEQEALLVVDCAGILVTGGAWIGQSFLAD